MSEALKVYSIPKLNDINYVTWSIRMKAILVRKGLWAIVSGTEKFPDSDKAEATKLAAFTQRQLEACSELILAVEDSQLAHMDSDDPKVVWDELSKVHGARGLSTQLAALRRFVRMEKSPTQSMSSWIGDVRSLAHQMKRIGIPLPDIFTILVLTSGLPHEYEAVVVALDSIDSTSLTLETTITRLINEEERHISQKATEDYKASLSGPSSNPVPSQLQSAEDTLAFIARTINVSCFKCGKKGHYQKDCPTARTSKRDEAHAISGVADSDDDWLTEVPDAEW